MKTKGSAYQERMINSSMLESPREAYQRELNTERVHRIAKEFDERIANEPKVSYRDGHYYVFDGQHTVAARKQLNGDKDLVSSVKLCEGAFFKLNGPVLSG